MTENAKAFFAEVSKNEELKARLSQIDPGDISKAIALAKTYGFELSAEDLKVEKVPAVEGQVADDELDAVAGGYHQIQDGILCMSIYGAPSSEGRDRCPSGIVPRDITIDTKDY